MVVNDEDQDVQIGLSSHWLTRCRFAYPIAVGANSSDYDGPFIYIYIYSNLFMFCLVVIDDVPVFFHSREFFG